MGWHCEQTICKVKWKPVVMSGIILVHNRSFQRATVAATKGWQQTMLPVPKTHQSCRSVNPHCRCWSSGLAQVVFRAVQVHVCAKKHSYSRNVGAAPNNTVYYVCTIFPIDVACIPCLNREGWSQANARNCILKTCIYGNVHISTSTVLWQRSWFSMYEAM